MTTQQNRVKIALQNTTTGCRTTKGANEMTLEAITYAIAKLIIKRRQAHNNIEEQERINVKLTKLYDLKHLMLAQGR